MNLEFEYNYLNEKLVSNKFGFIKKIDTYDNYNPYVTDGYILGNMPNVYFSYAVANIIGSNGEKKKINGAGASKNLYLSKIKAIGECIERVCGYELPDTYYCNEDYLKFNNIKYISGDELVQFSNEQYEFLAFNKVNSQKKIFWTDIFSISEKAYYKIPYQKVALYDCKDDPNNLYNQFLSTGLACSYEYDKALISGIYECVERDTFMINWRNKLIKRKVYISDCDNEELNELLNIISNIDGSELHLFDIQLEFEVNVIMSLLINNNNDCIGATVACAADLSPLKAIKKSLEELLLTNKYQYNLKYKNKIEIYDFMNINGLDDHIIFYSNPKYNSYFDYMINDNATINYEELKDYSQENESLNIDFILSNIESKGYKVFMKDITKKEIKNCGLYVLKVVIPGFEDINVSFKRRALGGKRLLKYYKADNYYDVPHPFP